MANLNSYVLFAFVVVLNLGLTYSKSQLIHLDENNWEKMLTGEWMVEFYAPWCPACKALQPLWEDFSSWSKDLDLSVAQIDVTLSPGLSGRFIVTALPTIFHVNNGEFRQYKGSRDKESFMSYIEDEKWKAVEAVPWWKSPSSVQMSVVSYFFKLSQGLRAVHSKLMEDYGLPSWGSYLIFAFVTILLGALLGLFMVCLIDLIYPPKLSQRTVVTDDDNKGDSAHDSGDEIIEEEITDEAAQEGNNVRKRKPRKAD